MNHENNNPWWLDGDFWTEFAPLMFDRGRWSGASADIDGLEALCTPSPGARILDAGCGPGRHSLEMAERGYRVLGVDLQDSYLGEARERAGKIKNSPDFIRADLREFKPEDTFDGAVSFFQSIGYTDDPQDDLAICRSICRSLGEGGWFLMETDGKEATACHFEERTWLERNGRIILLEYEALGAWSMLRNHWMFRDRDGSWKECDFSYRLYSAVELGELLEEAGFASIEFFGGLDGRPYDHLARNLVALARRP